MPAANLNVQENIIVAIQPMRRKAFLYYCGNKVDRRLNKISCILNSFS